MATLTAVNGAGTEQAQKAERSALASQAHDLAMALYKLSRDLDTFDPERMVLSGAAHLLGDVHAVLTGLGRR